VYSCICKIHLRNQLNDFHETGNKSSYEKSPGGLFGLYGSNLVNVIKFT
jgi:hypothetical protein